MLIYHFMSVKIGLSIFLQNIKSKSKLKLALLPTRAKTKVAQNSFKK